MNPMDALHRSVRNLEGEACILQDVRQAANFNMGDTPPFALRVALHASYQRIQYRFFDEGVVVDEKR